MNESTDAARAMDDIRLQVMWNRLLAVVEEQARTLMATAFSAVVRESGDLSAGLFDTRGRMLAQAVTGTPGHVNSMAQAVVHFLDRFPADTMKDGDHFITNDPWLASGHLHDVTVVSPAFHGGKIIGLFACTCHQVDIGGRGQGPDGRSVYEEGLHIPLMPLARAGRVNEDLLGIIRSNVRTPQEVEGDILSYMTSNEASARQLQRLMEEFALDDLDVLGDHIISRSKAAMLEEIRKLPFGTYKNQLVMDGMGAPITLVASLTISEDGIDVDYTGTSPASPHGINVVMNYCRAYSSFGVRCVVAPDVPNNSGSLAPIRISAPEDCVVNVQRPKPVAARHIIGQFLPDVVMGCLAQAVPDRVPAEGASGLWGIQLRGGPEVDGQLGEGSGNRASRPYELIFFNSGGSGARPSTDGLATTAFPSGVRAMPIEVVESLGPIVVWKKEFLPDSAGAGEWQGGLGQHIEVATIDGSATALFAMFDRVKHGAAGRAGGEDGAPGKLGLDNGSTLASMGMQAVPGSERICFDLPGGAGFGNPSDRDPARVSDDIREGRISEKFAQTHYGWNPESLT